MEELEQRAARHAALGEVTRLRITDLLAVGDRTPSELRATLGIAAPLLAHHLGVLERAGLVTRTRSEGDGRRGYLRLRWHSDRPAPTVPAAPRVVFVCSGNSSRSPVAAALWARASAIPVDSGGTRPAPTVAPGALRAARRHGLDLRGHVPRPVRPLLRHDDLVVTVCDRAHEELGDLGGLHWSVPNPADRGTPAAFEGAIAEIEERVATLAAAIGR